MTKEQELITELFGELLAYTDEEISFVNIPYENFIEVATVVIRLGYRKQKQED